MVWALNSVWGKDPERSDVKTCKSKCMSHMQQCGILQNYMPSEEEDAKTATKYDFEEKEKVNTWVKTNTKCEKVRNSNPYLLYKVFNNISYDSCFLFLK